MIGASSAWRANQPELSTTSSTTPDIASTRPPSSTPQCSARADRSEIAGQGGIVSTSARTIQISQGSANTTITNSEYSGSSDISVRRPRTVATAKPTTSSNNPIAAEVVSSNRPASIDQANQALRRFWPMICHECKSSSAHSGRASTSGPNSTPGELNAVTVSVSNTASTACWPPTMARPSKNSPQNVATKQSCANR